MKYIAFTDSLANQFASRERDLNVLLNIPATPEAGVYEVEGHAPNLGLMHVLTFTINLDRRTGDIYALRPGRGSLPDLGVRAHRSLPGSTIGTTISCRDGYFGARDETIEAVVVDRTTRTVMLVIVNTVDDELIRMLTNGGMLNEAYVKYTPEELIRLERPNDPLQLIQYSAMMAIGMNNAISAMEHQSDEPPHPVESQL